MSVVVMINIPDINTNGVGYILQVIQVWQEQK